MSGQDQDPFDELIDDMNSLRRSVEHLARTSLDKEEAEHLNAVLAESLDRVAKLGPSLQLAVERRLDDAVTNIEKRSLRATQEAISTAMADSHAESLKAAQSLSQAAGEARKQAWRYFGGFWVWIISMLATGTALGVLLAYGTETAKTAFSVDDMVRYSCGRSWFGGQVVSMGNGGSYCAFWIERPSQAEE